MPVDIAGGPDFAVINRTGRKRAFDEPARADELVVAVVGGESLTRHAGAVPVLGRLEQDHIRRLAIAAAQPSAEQRGFSPAARAEPRLIGRAGVSERGVLRGDTGIDDADDDVRAVEACDAPQPVGRVEQAEELRAVIRRERPNLVFPDVLYLGHVGEFLRLRRGHAGGEAVQAEAIAVNQARAGADLRQDALLLLAERVDVGLDDRVVTIERGGLTRCG